MSINVLKLEAPNQATLQLLEDCCELPVEGDIYMVLKSDRFIGFFNTPRDKSFEIHVYPRACPMSAKTILRCALLHTMREGEDILFSTYHPTLVTTALYLLPDMKVIASLKPLEACGSCAGEGVIECSYKANKEVYEKLTRRFTADTEVGYAVFV